MAHHVDLPPRSSRGRPVLNFCAWEASVLSSRADKCSLLQPRRCMRHYLPSGSRHTTRNIPFRRSEITDVVLAESAFLAEPLLWADILFSVRFRRSVRASRCVAQLPQVVLVDTEHHRSKLDRVSETRQSCRELQVDSMESAMERNSTSLPDMPEDVFVLVLEGLDAWDVIRCQKVSRAWREAFLNPDFLRLCLKKYPDAREVKALAGSQEAVEWASVFSPIASRYYHMSQGKARKIIKYKMRPLDQYGHWRPVGEWDYHESQPGGRLYYENAATHLSRLGNKPYLFRAELWSYDDGLMACAPVRHSEVVRDSNCALSIFDIDQERFHEVPFNCKGKVVRNITFRNRALVIEWAESEPYHDLNDNEKVHRHFATCYDVHSVSGDDGNPTWNILLRNEWKMHFLGLPLNSRDRFFSTHNGTHYAVYIWQPNRSMYTGDEDMPIEALFVWDIATPSPYLPSTDPTRSSLPSEDKRPHMLARYSFRELDFIGVRQHANISLLSMALDSESHSLTIRENICVAGQGYFDPAERLMQANTTTFPFLGEGPAFRREWDGDLPPYRGHCSMESTDIECMERWFLPVMEILDPVSGVRLSLVETCFTGQSVENRLVVRIKSLGNWVSLDDRVVKEVAGMGRIAGDERWVVGQNAAMELVVVKF